MSEPMAKADKELMDLIGDKTSLVVANKCDLPHRAELSGLGHGLALTSALTGEGLNELEEKMVNTVLGGKVIVSDALLVGNPRHREALERAAGSLERARRPSPRNWPTTS